MPICKKCNKKFPCRMFIDGIQRELKSRSYCLECSPYKSQKGYELRKDETAKKNNELKNEEGIVKIKCPICSREFKKTKNLICSSCRSCYLRWKNKQKAVEFLGGKCIECGITDPDVLSFHHNNPETKLFIISDCCQQSWGRIEEELKKCSLLCANCHMKFHKQYGRRQEVLDFYKNNNLLF